MLIDELIRKAVIISTSLNRKETKEEALIRNCCCDPNIDVRKNNIRLLCTNFQGTDMIDKGLINPINDPLDEIRCFAASYAGEKGHCTDQLPFE